MKKEISAEIIFVNYNPVLENEPIENFISWPKSEKEVSIRLITVPNEIHKILVANRNRKNVPVLEYLAKNVGIRRAKGQFILSMNPDIIIPESVLVELDFLKADCFYRVDRVDFKLLNSSTKVELDLIKKNAFKCYLKGFQYSLNGYNPFKLKLIRYFNSFKLFFHLKIIVWFGCLFRLIGWKANPHNAEFQFHCNVSGDFMLMHRDNWFELRGNPEATFMSLHTDALMVIMAATSGLKEKVLSNPIFHQDHTRRYDASKESDSEYRQVYLDFQFQAQRMIREARPIINNDLDWGLKNEILFEVQI
ncbi:MAG: hypothetical protein K9G41_06085 [Flavobacteriales bacterium]|nr:hypothetical protein [Flavobacteriales bacterium]